MPANAAIYSPRAEPLTPEAVRALARGATVSADAPGLLRVAWPGTEVLIHQMPEAELPRHLLGFTGYVRSRCELFDEALPRRIGEVKQCLGLVIEPDFDAEGRCEALVQALAARLEGFFFHEDSVYAADGTCLASPEEPPEEAEDRDAHPYGGVLPEGAQAEGPPSARRVARRALVLAAVAQRAFEEYTPAEVSPEPGPALVRWLESRGVAPELERAERRLVEAPRGTLAQRQVVEGSWRSEGLAVLAWALGVGELPAHDETVAAGVLMRRLGLLGEGTPAVLTSPTLRPLEELQRMERRLFVLHWRLRDFGLKPRAMDFAEFARTAWFGPFDITGIALAEKDLALGGLPISKAPPEQVGECQSIAMERHQAINWLLGRHPVYSLVDTPT
jgi:hypothetical protein